MRVPVISVDNVPLMPTKPSRARRWIKEGKAIGKFNKLGIGKHRTFVNIWDYIKKNRQSLCKFQKLMLLMLLP